MGEIVRYSRDKKKFLAASQTVATARIAHKICQHLAPNVPDFIQIGSLSAEL